MLKEGPEEVWTLVFGQQCVSHFLGEVVEIIGDEVGHLTVFGIPPTIPGGR
jgi:hypothetical protein